VDTGLREAFLEGGDQAAVPCGQAGGVAEFARGRIDQAGRADPHGVEPVRARLLGRALDQRDRLLDRGARPRVVADRYGRLGQHPPQQVGDEDGDAFRADVERHQVGEVRDDAVQLRVRSAALLARLPDHLDQIGGDEAFHQVGDGGAGQTGQLLQLSCRQRALLLEQSQGEPVVDGPGGAGGCGHAGILPDRPGPQVGARAAFHRLSIRQGP
jgi:hypothetical protein